MKVLIFLGIHAFMGDYHHYDTWGFCPKCKWFGDNDGGDFDIDSLANDNAVMICQNCKEILLCANAKSMYKTVSGPASSEDRCLRRLSHEEALAYAIENGFDIKRIDEIMSNDTFKEIKAYLTSTLKIRGLGRKNEDKSIDYQECDVNSFGELDKINPDDPDLDKIVPDDPDLDWCQSLLYYTASCTECGKCYESRLGEP